MAIRSFQSRLLILLIAVLVLLEAGTMISVHLAGRRALEAVVAEELRVGSRVFDRILETRARTLSDRTETVVLDFAFREAIATDIKTVTSVLENHGKRVKSDVVALVDLDGIVTADTVDGRMAGRPFPFAQMLAAAEEGGSSASGIVTFANHPYQFVLVPVLAPRTIAWVCAGFEIDEQVLADVRQLTSLEVSIAHTDSAGRVTWISTLPPAARAELASVDLRLPRQTTLTLGSSDYATLSQSLRTGDERRVHTLLQRSLSEAQRPFKALELQIFALSLMMLVAAVIAAVTFARGVSRPLRVLAEGAGRVERGDYVTPIVLKQQDEIGHLATAFNQMQSAIAAREQQIMFQATHDTLTGLPNRSLFLDRVASAIARARSSRASGRSVGMLMLDLDRFKDINDTLGHHFGDQLLIEIGRRLEKMVAAQNTVARLGGDEFAVHFSSPDLAHATEIAQRVFSAFDSPFVLADVSVDVNPSIGIALYPDHADDAATLMKRADIAMYDAKRNQSGLAVYDSGRDEHSLRRLSLMTDLRQAITHDELELFFQPKVDLRTEEVLHVEALVRWNHPKHKRMAPDEFIPLAEQSGKIGLITKWVIRKAIAQCAAWRAQGIDLTVAVNLSALDLFDSELPTFISGLLTEAALPPARLLLEITESAVMKDAAYAQKILADLKRRGVCLAIDDFGTGYSSLAHLKRLPVDELKIDKSFVQSLAEHSADDVVIVRSTIELGHNMGLTVIAEGVETAESWQILRRLGCDMAQGYYVSRPLPAAELTAWLGKR